MSEKECRLIYREAFCDPDTEFEDKLFRNCFKYCRTAEKDGQTAAMLFALPCELYDGNEAEEAVYIYGAATLKALRGRGYMTELINSLRQDGKMQFLVPADERLVPFYEKCGFKKFTAFTFKRCDKYAAPIKEFIPLSVGERASGEYGFTAMYRSDRARFLDGLYFPFSMID